MRIRMWIRMRIRNHQKQFQQPVPWCTSTACREFGPESSPNALFVSNLGQPICGMFLDACGCFWMHLNAHSGEIHNLIFWNWTFDDTVQYEEMMTDISSSFSYMYFVSASSLTRWDQDEFHACSTSGSAHFWHLKPLPKATSKTTCTVTARMPLHGLQGVWPWEFVKCTFSFKSGSVNTFVECVWMLLAACPGLPSLCLPCFVFCLFIYVRNAHRYGVTVLYGAQQMRFLFSTVPHLDQPISDIPNFFTEQHQKPVPGCPSTACREFYNES